jgi:hypothetical protein
MVAPKPSRIVALPSTPSRRLSKPSNRLATLKQSGQWQQLPRSVQRHYEASENRMGALVHVMVRHEEAVTDTRAQSLEGIVSSAREWQAFMDELGDTISEDERTALTVAKSNELATLLTAHQTGLDALYEVLETQLQEVMRRPEHEWVKPSAEDALEDFWTFGEAELKRRAYPPLSFWQSVGNALTFGMVADKQLRDFERARLAPQAPSPAPDEDEEVIDVDFTPR